VVIPLRFLQLINQQFRNVRLGFLQLMNMFLLLSVKYEPSGVIRYVYKHDKIQQVLEISVATFIPAAKSSVN